VHGFTHGVITAKRKRHVAHSTRNATERERPFDLACGFNEINRVIIVSINACGDRENIRVKNDIFCRKSNFIDEDAISPCADIDLTLFGVGLAVLIKSHDHRGRAVFLDNVGAFFKDIFAFFEADGIDNGFALNTFEASLDHVPFGGVDHDRNAGNIRF